MMHLRLMGVLLCALTPPVSAGSLDTDALTSGRVPENVEFVIGSPEAGVIRVLREYGPCLKVELAEKGRWELRFGETAVQPKRRYTLSASVASAAKAERGYTPDIANFRPENKPEQDVDLTGAGVARLEVMAGEKVLAAVRFEPTGWTTLTAGFDAPDGVTAVRPRLRGEGGGLLFIADVQLVEGEQTPAVYVPAADSLEYYQNSKRSEHRTLIQPGNQWGVYRPGEPIVWTVVQPQDGSFERFEWKIIDGYARTVTTGEAAFGATVEYQAETCGYYELVIRSVSKTDASNVLHDLQGAAVMTVPSERSFGGSPFAAGSCPPELGKVMGLTWTRGSPFNCRSDVSEINLDAIAAQVDRYASNGIMPLGYVYNVTYKTNAAPPGTNDDLPVDLEAFERAFETVAGLGDNFVEHFEFWNEPEGRLGATPHWTIENFTNSLIAAHRGIKRANPNAKVGVGSNLELVAGVNRCGGSESYEFLILHPYPWSVGKRWNTPEEGMLLEHCLSARQWLDANGGKDKAIWSTEFGYTTGATISGCSELQQAQMIVRAALLQLAGGLSRISVFRLDDVWFWGQVDGRFGLMRGSYTPKPSFAAYCTTAEAVNDLPYRGRLDAGRNLAALVFGDENATTLAFWTTEDQRKLTVVLPSDATLLDVFGAPTPIEQGRHELTADGSVQYVKVPVGFAAFTAKQELPFLAGLTGEVFDAAIQRKHYPIAVLDEAPQVDGRIDEWQGEAIRMANPSQGFEADVRAAFAGEFLYVMAEVRGSVPGMNRQGGANMWAGDCIELYFSPEPDGRPIGFYRECDFHVGIAPGIDGSTGQVANILAGTDPTIAGAECRYAKHAEGGYDLEAKVPLAFFGMQPAAVGDRFGFDIQLGIGTEAADGRRWQETWSGTGQNYINPYLWGDATAVAAASPPRLSRTKGTWPDGMHDSSLKTNVIELDQPRWQTNFGDEWPRDVYAIVGQWADNTRTCARADRGRLELGEGRCFEHASAIWKFEPPAGNRFAGGKVWAKVRLRSGDRVPDAFLAAGSELTLSGGGGYWQGFDGYNAEDFARAAADKAVVDEPQVLELPIQAGVERLFVAVTRPDMTRGTHGYRAVDVLEVGVEAELENNYGLTIRFDRDEPLWSKGEPIVFRVSATGDPQPPTCRWQLIRRDGAVREGESPIADGRAAIDLSDADAGFYCLTVRDEKSDQPLDRQDLVILCAQDPNVTPQQSIFGSHGMGGDFDLAKRMGVKWDATAWQWAWHQASPDAPIVVPTAETFGRYREFGIEPIVGIDTAPGWANGGKGATAPPDDAFYAHWAAYNRAVAAATQGQVTWFESWNEPNGGGMEYPWGQDGDARIAKAKAVQRHQCLGLREGNPRAKLIGARFAGAPAGWFVRWLSEPDSMLEFQDAMSAHPYCEAFKDENYQHKRPPEPTLVPDILRARREMDEHGAADQPLFWTEFGWDTQYVTADQHARWTARHLIVMNAYRLITRTVADCIFAFSGSTSYVIFRPARDVQPGEHRFRPVVGAFATAAAVLAGSTPTQRIHDHPERVRLYAFEKNGQTIYAAWATEEARQRKLTLPVESETIMTRINVLGDESPMTVRPNEPIELPENGDPIYLLTDSENEVTDDAQ